MANVQWASVGNNVLRDNAYQLNNATGVYERITLLEMAATNLVLQSDALATTWTAAGSPTRTNAVGTYAGRPFSRLAYTTNWTTDYVDQTITFTGDGVKAFSILAKADGANTGTFVISVKDATAAALRSQLTLTVTSGGAITGACSTGTLIKTVALADGVYRFDVQTTSVTAANSNLIYVGGVSATCPSILLSGVQASDNLVPSSLVPTTTATVTRAADVAYLDLAGTALATPRESTWYVKFIELGTSLMSGARIVLVGDASTAGTSALLLYNSGTGSYTARWYFNGSAANSAAVTASGVALNDQVELRAYVDPTGKITVGQSLNGAAETVTSGSAVGISATFASTKLGLNGNFAGSSGGLMGLQAFKAIPGNYTLAQMRAL